MSVRVDLQDKGNSYAALLGDDNAVELRVGGKCVDRGEWDGQHIVRLVLHLLPGDVIAAFERVFRQEY